MTIACEIEFENNPFKVIYAGQSLSGTVHLTVLNEEKTIRGVFIKVSGNAHCHWTRGARKFRKYCSADEKHFCEVMYLVGSSDGGMQLLPGSYTWSFHCQLPTNIPTSFEGRLGYIRYTACVVLDIPMWPDKEFEVPFTVIRKISLNTDSALRTPVVVEKEKLFSPCLLFCCKSGPLEVIAQTPVGGYVPGQTINVELAVRNKSNVPVTTFTVQLIKKVTYHARGCRKHQTIIITEENAHGCKENQEDVLKLNIRVPAIPPSDHTSSNMIKVHYFCRVIGSVDCCHSNIKLQLPITIGTYPILDTPEQIASTVPQTNGGADQQPFSSPNGSDLPLSDQNNTDSFSSVPTQFPTDESPTYEDAPRWAEGKHIDREFVPKYAMFKRQTTYSKHQF